MSLKEKAKGAVINALLGERTLSLRRKLDSIRNRTHRVTFYYQADDPYSHVLAQLMPELVARYPIDLDAVVVPSPTAEANPEPELRTSFAARDARELARYYEIEFPAGAETPDASHVDLANRVLLHKRALPEQLTAMQEVGDALWSGDQRRLEELQSGLGGVAPPEVEAALDESSAKLRSSGHYQGGMLQYGTEWYWGLDRVHYLEKRLEAEDLGTAESVVRRRDITPRDELREENGKIPLDFYYSFRSPYSHIAVGRMIRLRDRYPIDLRVKPVLPMVMRGLPVPRAKQLYIIQDVKREAKRLGVPFGRVCDPVGLGVERAFSIFPYAVREGRAAEFLESAGTGCWAEALDLAADADLRGVVERVGLDWAEAERSMKDDSWRKLAEENREALFGIGLWGVPSFKLGDYTTWGQDRIWILEDKLRRFGNPTS